MLSVAAGGEPLSAERFQNVNGVADARQRGIRPVRVDLVRNTLRRKGEGNGKGRTRL